MIYKTAKDENEVQHIYIAAFPLSLWALVEPLSVVQQLQAYTRWFLMTLNLRLLVTDIAQVSNIPHVTLIKSQLHVGVSNYHEWGSAIFSCFPLWILHLSDVCWHKTNVTESLSYTNGQSKIFFFPKFIDIKCSHRGIIIRLAKNLGHTDSLL